MSVLLFFIDGLGIGSRGPFNPLDGLENVQPLAIFPDEETATIFDGITRHSPEGRWFREFAERDGFHAAVAYRDSGQRIPDGGGPLPTTDA